MSDIAIHTAFFGDGEQKFAFTATEIFELEELTGAGIGLLVARVAAGQFGFRDIREVIRLGLIGAGMASSAAFNLVARYVDHRPLGECVPLALDLFNFIWTGAPPADVEKAGE